MRIFVSHSNSYDFVNNLYKPLRSSQLNKDHEIFLPHENNKSVETKDVIRNSDFVVAEVSFPSTGQGIELGWANLLNIPIVCMYKNNARFSGSLKYITETFISYKDTEDMLRKLIDTLSKNSQQS